ncbi:hypothetical protein LSCM1_03068 [Leishmania martiniquensis]|uniref:Nucleobase/nucleoside transporter n=1 Tax=Leishmania martiniquensis TaxID=1580590 RepID=A0A836H313_9TRYP|nr:hypothetical protein LSCM1_03068 [Leishmania martiniquensis]
MSLEAVLLYVAAATLGVCCLFAYNSFLSSPSYMEHYFQFAAVKHTDDVSMLPHAKNKDFWSKISTWMTVLMIVPMFLMQFAMLTPWVLRQKLQYRMIVGAGLSLAAALLVPVCAAGGGISEGSSMAVLIVACIVTGGATTVLESALFAFFGSLPTKYMTGFVMGGGFSGSISSLLRIVITVGLPPTFSGVKTSAVIFFSIGMALMVVVMAIVVLMRFSPLVRSYCKDYRRSGDVARCAQTEAAEKARVRALDSAAAPCSGSMPMLEQVPERDADKMMANLGVAQKLNEDDVQTKSAAPFESVTEEPLTGFEDDVGAAETEASVFAVVRKIWLMMVCLMANMLTTLVLFPGIGLTAMHKGNSAASGSSEGDGATWSAEAIMPMVIILMFNVGDTIGRLSVNFQRLWCPMRFVPVVVVVRAVVCVIPLVLGVCTPRVINSDANPITVFVVLGITNGYLIGLTMAYGSSEPSLTSKERAIAGACMCFALLAGITSGSVLSLLILTLAL